MDLSSISGAVGGGIGNIADWLVPFFGSQALQSANTQAGNIVKEGYDQAGNYIGTGYTQGRSDVTGGRDQALSSLASGYAGAEQAQQPYASAGQAGLNAMGNALNNGFSFDYQQDPGYQSRLAEGTNAIQSSAAAKGGLLSSATLKALTKYGQNFATNEYGNAYTRAKENYNTQLGVAQNMAGMGQSAANNLSNLRSSAGTGAANLYSSAGTNLGGMAADYGSNMGNIALGKSSTLADLALNRGNINASKIAGYGAAAKNLGNTLSDIGMAASF
jgi:hypothetical protein